MNIFKFFKSLFFAENKKSKTQAFSKKEEIIENIEDETYAMTPNEYNEYLLKKHKFEKCQVMKKLKTIILPNAWQKYILSRKKAKKLIYSTFTLDVRECDLSEDEMRMFYTETTIGNFKVILLPLK